jgi:photosystem II stability/assembly factor-like uncharacterized protein
VKPVVIFLCMIVPLKFANATQNRNSGGQFILNSVHFSDAKHGWAVGDGGLVLSTVDGGATWCSQNSGTTDDLESVTFVDNRHGWTVGFENGTILYTRDGGVTWQRSISGGLNGLSSVSFVDSLHGWIVGEHGVILATGDGGLNWHLQSINSEPFRSAWLMSTHFVDTQHGWASGEALLATSDGGRTWVDTQAKNVDPTNRALVLSMVTNSVYFVDVKHGWIAASSGLILIATDGGTNWRPQRNSGGDNLNSVYFKDLKRGWAVGNNGTILGTTDGGTTWVVQNSRIGPSYGTHIGLGAHLRSIFCWDNQNCWAVGSAESILSTTDGGTTWHIQH